jgi:putative thioredoxin
MAGPCVKLWHVLESLSLAYAGRFLLVNVNTQSQGALARSNGITSVPTVKIYQNGEVVESVYGPQSESALRDVIDKYAQPARDSVIARAIFSYQAGQVDEALALLADASGKAPDDIKPVTTAIKMLLREKRYADIARYVSELPVRMQAEGEISALQVHARMLYLAEQAPSEEVLDRRLKAMPDDPDSGLNRAALAIVQNDYATALACLLRVIQTDRDYAEQLPRKAMLVIFSLLGENHELTRAYQQQLRKMLH